MTAKRFLFAMSLVAVVAPALTGCGSSEPAAAKTKIAQLDASVVPSSLLGLRVSREDVAPQLGRFRRSYAQAAGLWSMRRADTRVQATLEIVQFLEQPRFVSSGFRRAIVNQIGSSAPVASLMGDHTVYRTTGTKQTVAVWFTGRDFFVLSIRDDFTTPRALIRRCLEIAP